jgi:hypothetical protein
MATRSRARICPRFARWATAAVTLCTQVRLADAYSCRIADSGLTMRLLITWFTRACRHWTWGGTRLGG